MKNKTKISAAAWAFLIIIFFFLFATVIRTFTRFVIIKQLGITNKFTELVLFDANYLNEAPEEENENSTKIDWSSLYPFKSSMFKNAALIVDADTEATTTNVKEIVLFPIFTDLIKGIESSVDTYMSDHLLGYQKFTELGGSYEKLLQWNFAPLGEYNNVLFLKDGYLANIQALADQTAIANATVSFRDYCSSQGIDFLYVMEPSKICNEEDRDISGYTDHSNQNADRFLQILDDAGVEYLDTRELIHEDQLNHHAQFYNTDHHWKAETGLWASKYILEKLQEKFDVDPDVLNPDKFIYDVYEDWFLGSIGKKVTLSQADPDDITLIYPDFDTLLHYQVPDQNIDAIDEFSVTYNMGAIEEKDYYGKNPYGAYNHGDGAVYFIENELIEDNLKVLVIHHSFANCVIPFLSLTVKNVDALDLRHFTGSVESFIEQTQPDVVIVMYTPSASEKVDYSKHKDIYDFR